ncbi:hypothetical protein MCBMB27_02615 [Methylobacterium phyllosphaerae]|uniref:Uncharacterized protein n=1 Tax=Methylobacterium phyllosphaerae TaxID=418223 RepID=A0AAE8HSJ3_9HYPH|nr:hypothetical protein MCBMB27_02615 [Methylobacterium phyllosphaerae]SFH01773.1 hypothetical protein SAMN05192567_11252 [Methylobacterium phyllosphaerae]
MHGWLILTLCAAWLAHAHLRHRLRDQSRAHHRRSVPSRGSPHP